MYSSIWILYSRGCASNSLHIAITNRGGDSKEDVRPFVRLSKQNKDMQESAVPIGGQRASEQQK
jgi:hypothetical protein